VKLSVLIACLSITAATGCSSSRDPPERPESERAQVQTARDPGNGQLPAASFDSIIERAIEIYYREEYDSVRTLVDPLLQLARSSHDSASEARILTLLGQTAYRMYDYDRATELGEASLQLKLQIGLQAELFRSYNLLGLVAWKVARRSDALEFFEKTEASAPEEVRDTVRAMVAINRGLVYTDLGDFARARTLLITGRDLSLSIGHAGYVAAATNNLAALQIWTGDPVAAISNLQQAILIFDSLESALGINALGQLGTAYTAIGEIGQAIAVLDSAIRLARERGMRDEEASNIEMLAEVHRTAGDYQRALALYAQAEEINDEFGWVEETGTDQRSRAEIYSILGETTRALEFAHRALETHESVDARWEEVADHVLLADLEHQAGSQSNSTTHLGKARQLAGEFGARTARMDVVLVEARIAERDGNSTRVLRVLEQARADLSAGGYDTEWEAEVLRARAYSALGRRDSATVAASRSVSVIEKVRAEAGTGMLRTAYMSRRMEAYGALVSSLLEQDEVERAFEAADRSRGRALLEHRGAAAPKDQEATPRGRSLRESDRLLSMIGMLTTELREWEMDPPQDRDPAVGRDVSDRLVRARSDYEALLARAADLESNGSPLLWEGAADADEIRQSLREDEALVQYFVTPDRLITFVVTRGEVDVVTVPISADVLARRVRIARDLLGSPTTDAASATEVLVALHGALIEPVLSADLLGGVRSVIVVPHGVLGYLPFVVLVNAVSGRYLVEDYDVQMLPIAAALPLLRDRHASESGSILESIGGVAFAPMSGSLPATRSEARAFRGAVRRGRAVIGNAATESRVRAALAQPSAVHLATHGKLNFRNPLFSWLEFAAGSGEPNDDGRLEVHEVLDMSISSPIVFLSGCETGVGIAASTEFASGEDYATLALAFLYAGAQNVVATLWAVEDEGAAAFTARYYSHLSDNGPTEALALAQRDMMLHERYASPYYWAAYQVAGAGLVNSVAQ
jgi:CHAT domain-containing protein/tetratricopeptide (TPR) repeat protein